MDDKNSIDHRENRRKFDQLLAARRRREYVWVLACQEGVLAAPTRHESLLTLSALHRALQPECDVGRLLRVRLARTGDCLGMHVRTSNGFVPLAAADVPRDVCDAYARALARVGGAAR